MSVGFGLPDHSRLVANGGSGYAEITEEGLPLHVSLSLRFELGEPVVVDLWVAVFVQLSLWGKEVFHLVVVEIGDLESEEGGEVLSLIGVGLESLVGSSVCGVGFYVVPNGGEFGVGESSGLTVPIGIDGVAENEAFGGAVGKFFLETASQPNTEVGLVDLLDLVGDEIRNPQPSGRDSLKEKLVGVAEECFDRLALNDEPAVGNSGPLRIRQMPKVSVFDGFVVERRQYVPVFEDAGVADFEDQFAHVMVP